MMQLYTKMRDWWCPIVCCGRYRSHAWNWDNMKLDPDATVPYEPAYRVVCVRCGESSLYRPPNR